MEFGLFQGGFVHKDLAAKNPNAEHDRLMSEVDLCVSDFRSNVMKPRTPSTTG